jgi:hypothetical protein
MLKWHDGGTDTCPQAPPRVTAATRGREPSTKNGLDPALFAHLQNASFQLLCATRFFRNESERSPIDVEVILGYN